MFRFLQPHFPVVADQHEEPAQNQEDQDLDGAGWWTALKCLEMHFCSFSAKEPGCVDPENIANHLVASGNFVLDIETGILLHPYPNDSEK